MKYLRLLFSLLVSCGSAPYCQKVLVPQDGGAYTTGTYCEPSAQGDESNGEP